MFLKFPLLSVLVNDPFNSSPESGGQNQGRKRRICFLRKHHTRHLLWKFEKDISASAPPGFINDIADVMCEFAVSLLGFVRGNLESEGVKALIVFAQVRADQRFNLFCGCQLLWTNLHVALVAVQTARVG